VPGARGRLCEWKGGATEPQRQAALPCPVTCNSALPQSLAFEIFPQDHSQPRFSNHLPMGKARAEAGVKKVPNRHVYARISYLHQAAHYLSTQQRGQVTETQETAPRESGGNRLKYEMTEEPKYGAEVNDVAIPESEAHHAIANLGLPRELGSHILAVSRKGLVKLSHELKRSICKRCNSILVPGQTAGNRIENTSRGGSKLWADVLVTTCVACGLQKRYPVGSSRQTKRKERLERSQSLSLQATTRDRDTLTST
jgi:ribonuclease P protein subunit RPR2